jgi:hypothetical protein
VRLDAAHIRGTENLRHERRIFVAYVERDERATNERAQLGGIEVGAFDRWHG